MTQKDAGSIPETPWARPWQEVVEALSVTVDEGLDNQEAKKRRKQYGHNRLRSAKSKGAWAILASEPGILLLDEATPSLDDNTQRDVERLVCELIRDGGLTALIVPTTGTRPGAWPNGRWSQNQGVWSTWIL
jgi:ABC-type cobalamin/Fe3+-siderophores transport system ATPase subunit